MFVGRREDNSIYGIWLNRQWDGQEEVPDDRHDPMVEAIAVAVGQTSEQLDDIFRLAATK